MIPSKELNSTNSAAVGLLTDISSSENYLALLRALAVKAMYLLEFSVTSVIVQPLSSMTAPDNSLLKQASSHLRPSSVTCACQHHHCNLLLESMSGLRYPTEHRLTSRNCANLARVKHYTEDLWRDLAIAKETELQVKDKLPEYILLQLRASVPQTDNMLKQQGRLLADLCRPLANMHCLRRGVVKGNELTCLQIIQAELCDLIACLILLR